MNARLFAVNLAAVLALASAGGVARANGQSYSLAFIPVPSSLGGTCNPVAVNDRGQAVGWIHDANGDDVPFVYNPKTGTGIVPGGFTSPPLGQALAINHAGQVVGYFTDALGLTYGFLWDSVNGSRLIDSIVDSSGTSAKSLGWTIDSAWQINTQGDILVHSAANGIGLWRMTTVGGVSTVSVQPVPYSLDNGQVGWGTRLNDNGMVLFPGVTITGTFGTRSFAGVWNSSTDVIASVGPDGGVGIALNNNGWPFQVAGWADYPAMVWFSGNTSNLFISIPGRTSYPTGVNDQGQVVGSSDGLATIGDNNSQTYIGNLVGSVPHTKVWTLTSANAISNPPSAKLASGFIVGVGTFNVVQIAWIASPY
jgi:probable HAF family extracellular repeat protein